jgi:hypothetical protein
MVIGYPTRRAKEPNTALRLRLDGFFERTCLCQSPTGFLQRLWLLLVAIPLGFCEFCSTAAADGCFRYLLLLGGDVWLLVKIKSHM